MDSNFQIPRLFSLMTLIVILTACKDYDLTQIGNSDADSTFNPAPNPNDGLSKTGDFDGDHSHDADFPDPNDRSGPSNSLGSNTLTTQIETVTGGLVGGHFDLDTYVFAGGPTYANYKHTHEFDDQYNVTGVDYFNIQETHHFEIDETFTSAKKFRLNLVNESLSPGAVINLNGNLIGSLQFNAAVKDTVFSTDAGNATQTSLQKLQIAFAKDALGNSGLHATETGCVKSNTLGPNGEYRNGALVLQARDAVSGALIWESAIFWHLSNSCFH